MNSSSSSIKQDRSYTINYIEYNCSDWLPYRLVLRIIIYFEELYLNILLHVLVTFISKKFGVISLAYSGISIHVSIEN